MNYTYDERRVFHYILKTSPNKWSVEFIQCCKKMNFTSIDFTSTDDKNKAISQICQTLKKLAQMPKGMTPSVISKNIRFLSSLLQLSAAESSMLESAVL